MEDIEKDLDKVAGGTVIESKDGKFFVVGQDSIGCKAIETKDGKFFVVDNHNPLSFNSKALALKVESLRRR